MITNETKQYAKEQEQQLKSLQSLREESSEGNNFVIRMSGERDDAERDYARILYSSSFRRLQGKMQLFIPYSNRFNRNRLTHSLEVAQIARVIAKQLGLQDTLTVQTCSLAHDIGHPPFGHSGEKTLNSLSPNGVQFEGNAQTFRIIRHLEEKHHHFNGLNLSYRTLLGTVKYFSNSLEGTGKFLYDEDYKFVAQVKNNYQINLKTIDAEIMDIADEIAYAAHDLEDAFYFKCFSVDELLHEFKISKFNTALPLLEKIVNDARKFASQAETYESSEEYLILFKKELTSLIVNELVNSICLKDGKLGYSDGYDLLSNGLKVLTFNAVSRSSENILYELKGKKIITKLYEVYMDKTFNKDMTLLPSEYRDSDDWERCVVDYIAGMMDEYSIQKYKQFFGESSLNEIYK